MAEGLAAVLWDVDGTLVENEAEGHRVAFNRAFQELGLPWSWDLPTYGRLLAIGGGRERLAAYLTSMDGAAPNPVLLDRLVRSKQAHYSHLIAAGRLPLRPGVARLISEIAAADLPQVIVTTSGRAAVEALAAALLGELRGAFCLWVCGEDVAAKKPDPQAYNRAIAGLELPPERLLAIEDSAQGLAAATAAGLACLVSLSAQSLEAPPGAFNAARAVLDGLGDGGCPTQVRQGPPCLEGQVTLSYLQTVLESR